MGSCTHRSERPPLASLVVIPQPNHHERCSDAARFSLSHHILSTFTAMVLVCIAGADEIHKLIQVNYCQLNYARKQPTIPIIYFEEFQLILSSQNRPIL